ncbi:MAG: virulence RhuM family protein [Muribaculaceae bacterium]|nr:virulence RhuM family protein [Muribaculaceae bacterium]
MEQDNKIIIYQNEAGDTRIEVKHADETVWLSQQQMADLYQSSRTNIVEHIQNIYSEGELDEISTCRKFRQVRQEGARQVSREIPFYNLDMIISVGYRIRLA